MSRRSLIESLESRVHFDITVPDGFTVNTMVAGLTAPTAMAFAPDGRLFVTEKDGAVRIVKDGGLVQTPFATLTVDSQGERGVIGIALDPAFASNGYVYLYYTTTDGLVHNRVSRFTASGDSVVPGSETVLLNLPALGATNHNGGALAFGPDGKLYIGVGENGVPERAPSSKSLFGKILRINPDGTIPADNPFAAQNEGSARAVWATGLRNPYTLAFSPDGTLLINDVGQAAFEEINVGAAGADYGWPSTEGATNAPGITGPIYAYAHGNGAAIIGGAFLDGGYYFGDLNQQFIRRLDTATNTVTDFATGVIAPVDLDRGPDGNLYVLSIANGDVTRISGPFEPLPAEGPMVATKGPRGNYVAGKAQAFSFSAKEGKKNTPASRFSYQVDLVSATGGTTSLIPLTAGKKSVKVTVPRTVTELDTVLRLTLTVTGANGGVTTVTRDVQPSVRTITTRANIEGVALTPATITAIAGTRATVGAPANATVGVTNYLFKKWSGAGKGKTSELTFTVPDKDGEIVANYKAAR